jgi:mannose-1-phosphate guanylyltransferase / phosphomannomutase
VSTNKFDWAILAGGLGSRMEGFDNQKPKSLMVINGKTILEQQINILKNNGVGEIHLLLGHRAQQIIEFVKSLPINQSININYHIDESPLGTGGALMQLIKKSPKTIGVSHGDLYIDTDILQFINEVSKNDCDWGQIVHPSNHIFDSDIVVMNESRQIIDYVLKPHEGNLEFRNLTNAGIYFFKSSFINATAKIFGTVDYAFDLDRDLLPRLLAFGLKGYGYEDIGTCLDVGTPERISNFDVWLKSKPFRGKVRPMVFMDRDGVINEDTGWICSLNQFKMYSDVPASIAKLNNLGIRVVVITNQPVVARGDISLEDLSKLHIHFENLLAEKSAFVNAIYFCPHHPTRGFPNEIVSLKGKCSCRKPEVGLFLEALERFPTDLSRTFMIGDSWRDERAAQRLGISFLSTRNYLQENQAGTVIQKPNFKNLESAVDQIIKILKTN